MLRLNVLKLSICPWLASFLLDPAFVSSFCCLSGGDCELARSLEPFELLFPDTVWLAALPEDVPGGGAFGGEDRLFRDEDSDTTDDVKKEDSELNSVSCVPRFLRIWSGLLMTLMADVYVVSTSIDATFGKVPLLGKVGSPVVTEDRPDVMTDL